VKVRYRRQALRDIDEVFQYLYERSPPGAVHVLESIHSAIQLLGEFPNVGRLTQDPTVRVVLVRRYRYRIFYSIGPDGIEILHVRHTSRRQWSGLAGT